MLRARQWLRALAVASIPAISALGHSLGTDEHCRLLKELSRLPLLGTVGPSYSHITDEGLRHLSGLAT